MMTPSDWLFASSQMRCRSRGSLDGFDNTNSRANFVFFIFVMDKAEIAPPIYHPL